MFPRNKEVCTQWVIRNRRADLDDVLKRNGPEHLNRTHVVEKDFRNKNLLSQGIWPGALPSVLLCMAKQTICRSSPKKRKREEELEPKKRAYKFSAYGNH